MQNGLRLVAAAAIATVLAVPARAQLYIGGQGGWTKLMDVDNFGNNTVARESFDTGFNLGGRLGYQWGSWRLEGELTYRENDTNRLDRLQPSFVAGRADGAERHSLSQMVNLLYDLDLAFSPVTPHIGGGLGVAQVTRNLSNMFGGTHDTATVFAYQAIAGVRYMLLPAVAIDLDYRYFATSDTTFVSTTSNNISSGYPTHNVVASLSWVFGLP